MRWPRRRAYRALTSVAAAVTIALVTGGGAIPAAEASARVSGPIAAAAPQQVPAADDTPASVPVGAEPDGTPVTIDTTVFTPGDGERHPAVLLAHGYGGSKDDLATRARLLAERGYVALAYSARGFGRSGGRVHVNDPAYEIADARRLLDVLARRSDVQLDSAGDPRVGVAGASYGGALGLMLAGADRRVDAVVSGMTWHDLSRAFSRQSTPPESAPSASTPAQLTAGAAAGVYQRRWASSFFTTVAVTRGPDGSRPNRAPSGDQRCGRYDPELCREFLSAARTGALTPFLRRAFAAHSPAPTINQVTAPTLLVQGMRDSLFGLDQADATARALAANGTPYAVRWYDGGHDGGTVPADEDTLLPWLDRYLTDAGRARGGDPMPRFTAVAPSFRRNGPDRDLHADAYPGLAEVRLGQTRLPLAPVAGAPEQQPLLSPPGGDPAAISSIPGAGGLTALAGDGESADAGGSSAVAGSGTGAGGAAGALGGVAAYRLAALPGQSAAFDTADVTEPVTAVGAPRIRLRVTSTTTDATLFLSLWKVGGGSPTPTRSLVAPVKISTRPGQPTEVEVTLPAGTYTMDRGSRWRVLVSASDASYATPLDARRYVVALAGPAAAGARATGAESASDQAALVVPTLPGAEVDTNAGIDSEVRGVGIALAALIALVLALAGFARWRRRRTDRRHTRAELAEVPLDVYRLVKTYRDGHRAVDNVSWRAEKGQVVGLLGPNGAGKTTTLRMVMGLISQDSGAVHVLGEPVHAGAPVLGHVGALIEGPGFLPHLTGRENLRAYWAATGRPDDEAGYDDALDVAALGGALDRPVRSYSHGMKQRLGIAQAMLGRPDVLVLDEPTNGLDPPQIAAMRPILREYAATGRTVVVSSHLLAEVEATCTHVVVMHRGRVVLTGAVADLVESADTTVVETEGPVQVDDLPPDWSVTGDIAGDTDAGGRVVVVAPGVDRAEVVAALVRAGTRIVTVGGRRRLEEVFLGVIADDDAAAALAGAHAAGSSGGESTAGAAARSLREVRPR